MTRHREDSHQSRRRAGRSPARWLRRRLRKYTFRRLPAYCPVPPSYAQIETTDKCNLKCYTCDHAPASVAGLVRRNNMSVETFNRILRQLPSVEFVLLHGVGEPMMNPALFDIIAAAKRMNKRVGFNTNGTLLNERNVRRVVESGLDSLVVSIDGATEKTFGEIRRGAHLDQVVGNVRMLMDSKARAGNDRLLVFVNTVVSDKNIGEIPDILRIVAGLGVKHLNLTGARRDLHLQKDEFRPDREQYSRLADLRALARELGLTLLFLPSPDHEPDKGCYWPWEGVYVTVEGWVTPCCCMPFAATHGLDNILEKEFGRIWNSRRYKDLRLSLKSDRPPEQCPTCPYRGREEWFKKLWHNAYV